MRHLREITETILLALLIFLAVRTLVQNYRVEGASMEPALHHGQYLLVNKFIYAQVDLEPLERFLPFLDRGEQPARRLFRSPRQGDVIVFRYPLNPSRTFIKRIVAGPGDTVEIREGVVYVNGQALAEPYIVRRDNSYLPPMVIPPGELFVLGDNRSSSSDSRQGWLVPEGNVVGLAWFSYWPTQEAGLVPNYNGAAGGP